MAQKTNWKFETIKTGLRLLEAVSPTLAGRVAFNLFLTPNHRPVTDAEQKVLDKAQRVVIYHGDDRLSGYVWGNVGATVLLVHGWESSAGSMTPLVEPLMEQGYRVVAFDAPAHGISHAKRTNLVDYGHAVREAIDQFGPVFAIVGHSFGGATTLLAASDGLPVERLVILAAPARLMDLVNVFCGMLSLSPRINQEIRSNILKLVGKPAEYFSMEIAAPKVKQPGLLVHDRRDPVVPYSDGEAIIAHWKNARLFSTDGLGHRNIRQNAAVIQEILGFLDEEVRVLRMVGD
jgi:pimeloyl-ACP methyl ester carboxylesterase